jgi:urea transport system permease protein
MINRELKPFDGDEALRTFRKRAAMGVLVFLFAAVPLLSWFGLVDATQVNKLGRYLCFAIVALGIDLLWGYTGLLSLCQAFFFCLGGYAMAMHLSLPQGGGNVRPEYHNIPQFFFFNNVDVLPGWWAPFSSLPFALGAAVLVPALLATIFGFTIFRSRVKGVYFAIITQAVAWGAFLLFCRNEMLLGGTNGLTNFDPSLNRNLGWILFFYVLTGAALVTLFLVAKHIARSRLGRLLIAVRDKEMLLNFMAYRPQSIKLFAFVIASIFAAIGGILYVPQNGIITPNIMRVEDSIWMIVWVALGGRGRLWGAMAGALIVNYAYSITTSDMPSAWPFLEGGMFIAVVMLFPSGLVGLWDGFENDVASGARASNIVAAMIVGFLALIFAKSALGSYIPHNLTLWVAATLMLVLAVRGRSLSGAVLAAISFFFTMEALGLVPNPLQVSWLGVPLKYYILLVTLGGIALLSRLGGLQQTPGRYYEPAAEHR